MTSEVRLGITKQPADSCPLINEALGALKEADAHLRKPDTEYPDQMESDMSDAEWHIDQAKSKLEEIREANEKIRAWGQEWKDLAKKLSESHELITT